MGNNITELVFILDMSGSMQGLRSDTIGGFNSMIEKQRAEPGRAFVSTVLFNTESKVVHDRVPLEKVEAMTDREYTPMGGTALLDAVGSAIHHIGNIHKYARPEDVPENTLLVITTDGMENSSVHYDLKKVKKMIERQQERYGWKFIFLGANIDAAQTAHSMGIAREYAADYCADSSGSEVMYSAMCEAVTCTRKKAPSMNWRRLLDEDNAKRKAR